ncbi:hypothetical protein BJY24_003769 [Nocardia transvalensis]|uniref:Uncharacterized protein n=1 Tax=Nocardia transvalensis TaxID=37333 RepID=A0A7W9PEZ3_9NOCA|nr:hypothetical protein [Nocardia transvalensis]MBB5914902.1 hypothetical protein [Nocardia transvalensis]
MTYPPGGPPFDPQQPQGYQPESQPPSYYPPEGYPAVGDYPPQQPPVPPPPRKRRTGLIVVPLVLVLAAAGAAGIVALLTGNGKGPFASEEKKIELAIRDFYGTIATDGVDAAMAKSCRADRDEYAALPAEQRAAIASETLTLRIDAIDAIVIDGDQATAKVHGSLAPSSGGLMPDLDTIDSAPEYVRREGGDWKVCAADHR